ncbi:MAG: hypothetical protein R3E79_34200 [Caldilineaceae bacterium]
MKEFVDKFIELERKITEQKGSFTLFALFLRENALNKWDLLVAAPWIEADRKAALAYLSKQLQLSMTTEEMLQISRIVIIDETNPTLDIIHRTMQVKHNTLEITDSDLFGLQIKRAFIISAQTSPLSAEMAAM